MNISSTPDFVWPDMTFRIIRLSWEYTKRSNTILALPQNKWTKKNAIIIYNLSKLYLLDYMKENFTEELVFPDMLTDKVKSNKVQVWLTFWLNHYQDIVWSLKLWIDSTLCIDMVTTLLLQFYDLVKQQETTDLLFQNLWEAADLFISQWVITSVFRALAAWLSTLDSPSPPYQL